MGHVRNAVTRAVCNFLLKHLATDDYGQKVSLLIKQGLYHAQRGNGPYIKEE